MMSQYKYCRDGASGAGGRRRRCAPGVRGGLLGLAALTVAACAPAGTTTHRPTRPSAPATVATVPRLTAPAVALLPSTGGYRIVGADGEVVGFGAAGGSRTGQPGTTVVGAAADPGTGGYWTVGPTGAVTAWHAPVLRPGRPLDTAVVGIAAAPGGRGFWLAGRDGTVRAVGTAPAWPVPAVARPVVAIAADPRRAGYWLLSADGTVTAVHAPRLRAVAPPPGPAVALAATPDGAGAVEITASGAVTALGTARALGSTAGETLGAPAVAVAATAGGYWIADGLGRVYQFGSAGWYGSADESVLVAGDSLAWTLGDDLRLDLPGAASLTDGALIGCGIVVTSALVSNGYRISPFPLCDGSSAFQWPQQYQAEVAADAPDVVLLLVGYWETNDHWWDGQWANLADPGYASAVAAQLDRAVGILRAGGAHVVALTMPYVDQPDPGPLAPQGVITPAKVDAWNTLLRRQAAGEHVPVVDLNAEVDPGGRFTGSVGALTVRSADGVHFISWSPEFPGEPPGPQTESTCLALARWLGPWLWPQVVGRTSPP